MKITLCGSTRFKEDYIIASGVLTLAGHLIYSVGFFGHVDIELAPEEKRKLDAIHLHKIMESDAIFVLTGDWHDPYIGESTRREIDFAEVLERNIYYSHDELDMKKLIVGCMPTFMEVDSFEWEEIKHWYKGRIKVMERMEQLT